MLREFLILPFVKVLFATAANLYIRSLSQAGFLNQGIARLFAADISFPENPASYCIIFYRKADKQLLFTCYLCANFSTNVLSGFTNELETERVTRLNFRVLLRKYTLTDDRSCRLGEGHNLRVVEKRDRLNV